MPGATVEVKNIDTNAVRSVTTGDFGHFEFLSLQPGNYELTVRKEGFATVVEQGISLTVGRAISLRVAMKAASTPLTVTVTAEPAIETTTASSTSTLGELTVATTPVL